MSPYARRGQVVRLVYLAVAALVWALTGGGRFRRRGLVVLCYHAVTDGQRARFERQVRWARERAVSLAGPWSGGRRTAAVCFTFDDAFACLLRNALPLMRDLGVPALVFVPAGLLGEGANWAMEAGADGAGDRVFTAMEIREAARTGLCALGSHTMTHPDLAGLSGERCGWELAESRRLLGELAGRAPEDLALPYGSGDETVCERARATGYRRVLTLSPAINPLPLADGEVARFSMSPDAWFIEFRLTVDGAYAWLGPWRKLVRGLRKGPRSAPAHPAAEQLGAS